MCVCCHVTRIAYQEGSESGREGAGRARRRDWRKHGGGNGREGGGGGGRAQKEGGKEGGREGGGGGRKKDAKRRGCEETCDTTPLVTRL